jgi:hypothetical protein
MLVGAGGGLGREDWLGDQRFGGPGRCVVRRLYGHRDHERALDRVTVAYERTASFSQPRLW